MKTAKRTALSLAIVALSFVAVPAFALTNTNTATANANSVASGDHVNGGGTAMSASSSNVGPAFLLPNQVSSTGQAGGQYAFTGHLGGGGMAAAAVNTSATGTLFTGAAVTGTTESASAGTFNGNTSAATFGGSQALVIGVPVGGNPFGASGFANETSTDADSSGGLVNSHESGSTGAGANISNAPGWHW